MVTGKRDPTDCQTHTCPGWRVRDRSFQRYVRLPRPIETARILRHPELPYSGIDRWQISTKLRGNGYGIRQRGRNGTDRTGNGHLHDALRF